MQLRVQHLDLQRARVRDVNVGHVADVHPLGTVNPVLRAPRIEVTACRLEARLARADRVNMERMSAGSIDAVCLLQLAHVARDLDDVVVRDALDRRHVAEFPVMGANALPCGEAE